MSDGLLRWGYLPRPRRTKAAPRKRRTAHRPVPSLGKSGTHCENRAFRGSQTAPPAFCNPGQRDPWQAGFVRTNPMLAETKTRRCIRSRPPRRSHANPQSSAHLQLPSSCLAGVAGPATWRAYGLPGWEADPQAQGNKSGPAGSAGQPRDHPQLRENLGPIGGIQQPEGRRRPRSSSRHCRVSDPGRPWRSCQTRNRLRFWFCK